MEKRELSFCRYADDVCIYVGSERSANRILEGLIVWIEKHLKLNVNQNKSGAGRPWDSQFLGFRITEDEEIAIAPKNIEKYKTKVRELWNARQSLTSKQRQSNSGGDTASAGGITSNWPPGVGILNAGKAGHVVTFGNVSGNGGTTRRVG